MISDQETGHDPGSNPGPVQLSAAAHRVAAIAAAEAGLPLANWIALAILGMAADQAGVTPQPDSVGEPMQAALRRLEAKLDRALSAQPAGQPGPGHD